MDENCNPFLQNIHNRTSITRQPRNFRYLLCVLSEVNLIPTIYETTSRPTQQSSFVSRNCEAGTYWCTVDRPSRGCHAARLESSSRRLRHPT
eukprot:scaffold128551_cov45-Attheya_sp.AAC.2